VTDQKYYHWLDVGPGFHPGALVRQRRREVGLQQKELAAMLGLSQAAVSLFERGLRGVNLDGFRCYLDALDCNLQLRLAPREVDDG